MQRTLLAAAVFGIATAGPTSAAMPDYDAKAWCRQVAGSGGSFSEVIYGGCFAQEQGAYNQLRAKWDALPSQARQWCDQVARSGGTGSFVILEGCISQEMGAAEANKNFEFKREVSPASPPAPGMPTVYRGGQ